MNFAAANNFPIAISFYDTSAVAELTSQFRAQARDAGWQPGPDDIVYRAWTALGDTDAQADQIRAFLPANAAPAPRTVGTDADGHAHRGADTGGTGFGIGSVLFCGGPATVIEQIRAFHQATGAGVLDLTFGPVGQDMTLASIRRFGEQVLPEIRDIAAGVP